MLRVSIRKLRLWDLYTIVYQDQWLSSTKCHIKCYIKVGMWPLGPDLSPAPSLAESRRDADWAVCGRSVSLPASANAFPSPGEISTGNPAWFDWPQPQVVPGPTLPAADAPKITLETSRNPSETHLLPFVKVQVPRKVLALRFVQLWPWPRQWHR